MKEVRVQRASSLIGLIPVGDEAEELIKKMPVDKVMTLKYSFPRSPGNHRRFFAFINTVFDMQDHFVIKKVMREWIQMKAGYFVTCVAPNGKTMFFPESIAFDSMDEVEFCQLFASSINVVMDWLEEKMSRNQIMQIIDFI